MKWSERLRRIAEPVLAGTPLVVQTPEGERRRYVEMFEDEQGHRRVWDGYLLGWMLGVAMPASGEGWMWSWDLLHGHEVGRREGPPFFAEAGAWALEQETEKELAGLHGLWWVERQPLTPLRRAGGDLSPPPKLGGEREERRNPPPSPLALGVEWIMENIQPDNATGRPWGIMAFLSAGAEGERYGEMMLHNCLVGRGRPDLLSAVILLDAARGLERVGL